MKIRFEWDSRKAEANLRKHGVTFEEAITVFADPLQALIGDPDHSFGEERLRIFGRSERHRLVVVVHVEEKEATRIISARLMTRSERRRHERG